MSLTESSTNRIVLMARALEPLEYNVKEEYSKIFEKKELNITSVSLNRLLFLQWTKNWFDKIYLQIPKIETEVQAQKFFTDVRKSLNEMRTSINSVDFDDNSLRAIMINNIAQAITMIQETELVENLNLLLNNKWFFRNDNDAISIAQGKLTELVDKLSNNQFVFNQDEDKEGINLLREIQEQLKSLRTIIPSAESHKVKEINTIVDKISRFIVNYSELNDEINSSIGKAVITTPGNKF